MTVQLIGLNPETLLWAHAYERSINDAFGLETDATQALTAAMHLDGSAAGAAQPSQTGPCRCIRDLPACAILRVRRRGPGHGARDCQ